MQKALCFWNTPFQLPTLTFLPSQSAKEIVKINPIRTFNQKGICPGLPGMTTLLHSSKRPSLGGNLHDHLIYPCLHIRHYKRLKTPRLLPFPWILFLTYSMFDPIFHPFSASKICPLCYLKFMISLHPIFSPRVFFSTSCSNSNPQTLTSEDSASHLGLVGGWGGGGVLLAPHCCL